MAWSRTSPSTKSSCVSLGVRSQPFSCLILATGRNKGKLDGGGCCFFAEEDAHAEGGFVAEFTTEEVTFSVIGGKDKTKTFGLNCETLAPGSKE